jgi:hypothetical protein
MEFAAAAVVQDCLFRCQPVRLGFIAVGEDGCTWLLYAWLTLDNAWGAWRSLEASKREMLRHLSDYLVVCEMS